MSEHTAERDAAYCPNCGHHVTLHPGNVLCFKSEHMRCEWTPEDIRAGYVTPPGSTADQEADA